MVPMVSFCAPDHNSYGEEKEGIERFICSHPTLYGDQLYPAFDLRLLHGHLLTELGPEAGHRLLKEIGVTPAELEVRQFVLAWQVLKAMSLAQEWLPGQLAGFYFGRGFRPEHLQGLQRSLGQCQTLGQAYQLVRANPNLVGSFTDNIESVGGPLLVVRPINIGNIDPPTLVFLFLQGLSSMLSVARHLTNRDIQLARVELAVPSLNRQDRATLEQAWGCQVITGAPFFQWALNAEVMAYPVTWQPSVRALEEDEVAADDTDSLINAILSQLLACQHQFPSQEAMAERLNLSSRTLRRRLSAIDSSYQRVLNQVRCQLAIERIRAGEQCIDTIAESLGFNEPCNFRHAFKRWTGKAPGEFMTGLPLQPVPV